MKKAKSAVPFQARPVVPKSFSNDPLAMVKCSSLQEGSKLPLVIQAIVSDLDYLAWMQGQRDFILEKLLIHGAILFRGFAIRELGDFEAFAASQTEELFGDYGDLPPEDGKVYGVTPYPAQDTILFHNESSHMHRWPTRQFFYCRVPAATGGATPIVDCRAVLQNLSEAEVQQFRTLGLRYVRNFHPGVDVDWRDYFKTQVREEVENYCRENGIDFLWHHQDSLRISQWAPAVVKHPITGEEAFFNQIQLHHTCFLKPELLEALSRMFSLEDMPRNVTFGDGTPIPNKLAKRIETICWQHCSEFFWQSGDVLMVDNMLISHARRNYTLPREMYVAMGDLYYAKHLTTA